MNVLPKISSDHSPILISLHEANHSPQQPNFIFQVVWLTHQIFMQSIREHWRVNDRLDENLRQVIAHLKQRNRETFGHILQRKRRLWAKIGGVQRALTVNSNSAENK